MDHAAAKDRVLATVRAYAAADGERTSDFEITQRIVYAEGLDRPRVGGVPVDVTFGTVRHREDTLAVGVQEVVWR